MRGAKKVEIQRDFYIEALEGKRRNGRIKVLTGIIGSGKTYLLDTLFRRYLTDPNTDLHVPDSHIIYFDLEKEEDPAIDHGEPSDSQKNLQALKSLRNPNNLARAILERMTDGTKDTYYVFLDEAEYLEAPEKELDSLMHMDGVDLYAAMSKRSSTWKYNTKEFWDAQDEVRIFPLSFQEYLSVQPTQDFDYAWQSYATYGGLPQVASLRTAVQKAVYLRILFSNVYIRDIAKEYHVQNADEMIRLSDQIANSVGRLTGPTEIGQTFKDAGHRGNTNKTITKHVGFLSDAFLVEEAKRYDIKAQKTINGKLKYYFADMGLRNARRGFHTDDLQNVMENVVYNELVRRGYDVYTGIVILNGKNEKGISNRTQLPVDFAAIKGTKRFYVQVAWQLYDDEAVDKELFSMRHIYDSFPKIVIVRDDVEPHHTRDGYLIIGLKDFLLDPQSIFQ